jgi:hypothetical protein
MNGWTLDLFTSAVQDYERAQYQILGGLQQVRKEFSENRIYPHLGELINLYGTLQTIVQRSEGLRNALPGRIREVDLDAQEVLYDKPELDQDELQVVEDLIDWALPQIKSAIEEGRTIFEFVEANLLLEEVGIVPSYVQEGYLLVSDHESRQLHILQYNFSIFTGATERYRSLRTTHVKSVAESIQVTPRSVKLALMEERRELPNPATYFFDTDLDFPFEPTMLPVAKRKLMRYLFGDGGSA